jgi:hypothetical protein
MKRKGVTTGSIVKAINSIERAVDVIHYRMSSIEAIIDKYIELQGNGDEFADFLEQEFSDKQNKDEDEDEETSNTSQ